MNLRLDLALVAEQIPAGSRVLDLGCGSGALLAHLAEEKSCLVTGVEINSEAVLEAIRAGVPVLERDVVLSLPDFGDRSYDTVVLSRTLQTILQPEFVLREMARIGDRLIVSVPNFGFYQNRLRLLAGRMPMSKELPYAWYDTPNLRHTTLVDLEMLFARLGFVVESRFTYTQRGRQLHMYGRWANLMAGAAVYVLNPNGSG